MKDKKRKCIKIKICTDSHCAELKGKKVARRIQEWIDETGAENTFQVKKCDCLKRCKHGPVVAIPKIQLVFETVKPKEASTLMESLLAKTTLES